MSLGHQLKCKHCDKDFSRRSSLKRHLVRIHSQRSKIYTCDFCQKCFSRHDVLERHIGLHTGKSLEACRHCQHQVRRDSLQKHEASCRSRLVNSSTSSRLTSSNLSNFNVTWKQMSTVKSSLTVRSPHMATGETRRVQQLFHLDQHNSINAKILTDRANSAILLGNVKELAQLIQNSPCSTPKLFDALYRSVYSSWQDASSLRHWLLDNGVRFWYPFNPSVSMVHVAVLTSQVDILRFLADSGVSVSHGKNRYNGSPLYYAIDMGHLESCQVLLNAGALVDVSDARESLFQATRLDNLSIVAALVSSGADVNARTRNTTPLYLAIQLRREHIVDLLAKNGVQLDGLIHADHGKSWTHLMITSFRSYSIGVKSLLAAGADPNIVRQYSNHEPNRLVTALCLATSDFDRRAGIIGCLLNEGADPDLGNPVPLDIALQWSSAETVETLLEYKPTLHLIREKTLHDLEQASMGTSFSLAGQYKDAEKKVALLEKVGYMGPTSTNLCPWVALWHEDAVTLSSTANVTA